jgi:hypothetical protein
VRVFVQHHRADGPHPRGNAWVAQATSGYWDVPRASAADGTRLKTGLADDELGFVLVVVEEFGVRFLDARELTVDLRVLDDADVCQEAVPIARVLGTHDLLEDIYAHVISGLCSNGAKLALSQTDNRLAVRKLKVVLKDRIECVRILGLRDDHRGHLDCVEMPLLDVYNLLVCVVADLHRRSATLVQGQRLHRSNIEWRC